MTKELEKAIESAEMKKQMEIPQTGYTIGFRGRDSLCYTLATVPLDEIDRQSMFYRLDTAMIVKTRLEGAFPSYEFCIFTLGELR